MHPLAIRQIRDHYITGFSESKHFFEPADPPRENPTAAPVHPPGSLRFELSRFLLRAGDARHLVPFGASLAGFIG
jgi:hypothetical protein